MSHFIYFSATKISRYRFIKKGMQFNLCLSLLRLSRQGYISRSWVRNYFGKYKCKYVNILKNKIDLGFNLSQFASVRMFRSQLRWAWIGLYKFEGASTFDDGSQKSDQKVIDFGIY